MKKLSAMLALTIASSLLLVSPANAFSTKGIAPIRKIPVNARNFRTGAPGVWTSGAVYTRCGAIGVDAVFYNNSSNPTIETGKQIYNISIWIDRNGTWVHVPGSEVEHYTPSHLHHRWEYDRYIRKGAPYKYRVQVANHTSAPLLGTMWVNAAANDNNPAEHDVADCQ